MSSHALAPRRAEGRCQSSTTQLLDLRSCIGDDAKWLDGECVAAYLDAAGGGTRAESYLATRLPDYVLPLQELSYLCGSRSEVRPRAPAMALVDGR